MVDGHGGPRRGSGRRSNEEIEAIARGESEEVIAEIRERRRRAKAQKVKRTKKRDVWSEDEIEALRRWD